MNQAEEEVLARIADSIKSDVKLDFILWYDQTPNSLLRLSRELGPIISGKIREHMVSGSMGFLKLAECSVLFLPVKKAGRADLFLVLGGSEELLEENIARLSGVASLIPLVLNASSVQAVSTLERAALRELDELSLEILRETSISSILARAAEAACRLTRADLAYIMLFRPDDINQLVVEAWFGAEINSQLFVGRRIRVGEGITGKVAATAKSLLVNDVSTESSYISFTDGTRSELAVPLLGSRRLHLEGVLNLESRNVGHFTFMYRELAERFASQVAIALQQARKIEKLEQVQEQLERAEGLALIGLLYGEDIHLVSNKLGAARQLAENIKHAKSLEKAQEFARIIAQNTKTILDLVYEIRSSVQRPPIASFDIHQLLDEVFSQLRPGLKMLLNRFFSCSDAVVLGFRRQIGQVFRVVMRNGLAAMEGVGTLSIQTESHAINGIAFVTIRIGDSGKGIPASIRDSLFSLNVPRPHVGFGLGLAWCRLFLEMYGGHIAVESTDSHGTVLRIDIPRNVEQTGRNLLLRGSTK